MCKHIKIVYNDVYYKFMKNYKQPISGGKMATVNQRKKSVPFLINFAKDKCF